MTRTLRLAGGALLASAALLVGVTAPGGADRDGLVDATIVHGQDGRGWGWE